MASLASAQTNQRQTSIDIQRGCGALGQQTAAWRMAWAHRALRLRASQVPPHARLSHLRICTHLFCARCLTRISFAHLTSGAACTPSANAGGVMNRGAKQAWHCAGVLRCGGLAKDAPIRRRWRLCTLHCTLTRLCSLRGRLSLSRAKRLKKMNVSEKLRRNTCLEEETHQLSPQKSERERK